MGPAYGNKAIAFSSALTAEIQRGYSDVGRTRAGSGYGTKSEYPIREGGHRGGLSSRQGIRGFTAGISQVPRKDEGLRPIIDLRQLNRSVMRLNFKLLILEHVVPQIRSEDWFVTTDLIDAYFHVYILPQYRKFRRFAFGGEAYQY